MKLDVRTEVNYSLSECDAHATTYFNDRLFDWFIDRDRLIKGYICR
jgi:hypothetical protein